MTDIFLAIIAFATLIGCAGIFLVSFICFHMIYGYREWFPKFMDWYIDEVLPKQMKRSMDNFFKDDVKEQPKDEAQ